MAIDIELIRGQKLTNVELCKIFRCGPQGGMRRSHRTNTLVLISNHVESLYDDRWIGAVFHYTGMGQTGDQSLSFMQNKTLAESETNGVEIHLFEVDREKEYRYQGRVSLAGEPYTEIQPDQNKKNRTVFVFPLRLAEGTPSPISNNEFTKSEAAREKKAHRLSDAELEIRASKAPKRAGERMVTSLAYERDPYVSLMTKRRAMGICELCKQPAPFQAKNGLPYLETHHIEWISRGGEDSLENTVALCPNCHRRMHLLDSEEDKSKLAQQKRKS